MLEALLSWYLEGSEPIALLRGPAGSGKTTLLGNLLKHLNSASCFLAAPTGRAARILNSYTRRPTQTIHQLIYTLDYVDFPIPLDDEEDDEVIPTPTFIFRPQENRDPENSLYIIDEASMIGDVQEDSGNNWLRFGSGRLLYDLLQYIFFSSKQRHKLLLVGDPYQLPPVGMSFSPALRTDYLHTEYGLTTRVFDLETIYRQAEGSPVLELATAVRNVLARKASATSLHHHLQELPIQRLSASEAPTIYRKLIGASHKYEQALILSPWNETVQQWNSAIRELLWGTNAPLQPGDRLLITRNNPFHGVFNGDFTEVEAIYPDNITLKEGNYTLTLQRVRLKYPGDCWIIDDLLYTTSPTLSPELQGVMLKYFYRQLFGHLKALEEPLSQLLARQETSPNTALQKAFRKATRALYIPHTEGLVKSLLDLTLQQKARQRYPDDLSRQARYLIRSFGRRIAGEVLRHHPHINALHVRFGYAATIHKAQGGQWPSILLHVPEYWLRRSHENQLRSLYTGITRAINELYLILERNVLPSSPQPEENREQTEAVETEEGIPIWKIDLLKKRIRKTLPSHLQLTCLDQFPYRLRYRISEHPHEAIVDITYNKETHITHTEILSSTAPLAWQERLRQLLQKLHIDLEFPQPFLEHLYQTLSKAFQHADMVLSDLQHRNFQEIYTFEHATGTYKLIIFYNRRNEITRWRWNTPPPQDVKQVIQQVLHHL